MQGGYFGGLSRQPVIAWAGEFLGVMDVAVSWRPGVSVWLRRVVCRGIRAVPVGHQQMVDIYMSE